MKIEFGIEDIEDLVDFCIDRLNEMIAELESELRALKHDEFEVLMFKSALMYNEIEEDVRVRMMAECPPEDDDSYDQYIESIDVAVAQAVADELGIDQQLALRDEVSGDYYYGKGDRRYDDSRIRKHLDLTEVHYNICLVNIKEIAEQIEQIVD